MAETLYNSNNNLNLNSVTLTSTTLDALANEINSLSTSSLASIRAEVNTNGELEVVSEVGGDLRSSFSGSLPAGTVERARRCGTGTQTVNMHDNAAVIGGQISLVLAEGYSVASASPEVGNLFAPMTEASFTAVPINALPPDLPSTYNHATTSTIFDSLGNAHTLEQLFVDRKST